MGQIRPGTLFLSGSSAELSLNCEGGVTCTQSSNDIQPFEGNRKVAVTSGENEFDTPALVHPPGMQQDSKDPLGPGGKHMQCI